MRNTSGQIGVTLDSTLFRSVLAQWPSGVAVVTTLDGGSPWGMTASSFCSVSLDPPLVSVCLGNHLPSRALVERAGVFAVSFLGKDHAELGQVFAGMRREVADRFAGNTWDTAVTGCPILADATGWLDCEVAHAYPGGDHTIFVGRVRAAGTPRVTAPLLFHSRSWGQLADPLPDSVRLSLVDEEPDAFIAQDKDDFAAGQAAHAAASASGRRLTVYIADAFDPARESTVLSTLETFAALPGVELGVLEAGQASPLQVRRLLQDAVVRVRPAQLRVRLLGHHGLGLVNALVAMKSGVRHFDTSRHSSGAGLPALDLLLLAHQLGVECSAPADLDAPSERE